MSIVYDGLKEVQKVRQSKFSQALKKSSLEKLPSLKAQAWKFKGVLVFLVLLILAVSFAVFFALRSYSARAKVINPVTKPVQLINAETKVKAKARITSPHKKSRHKIKKKETSLRF